MTGRAPASPPIHYESGRAIHHWLERRATTDGGRIALRVEHECYTYRDLDGFSSAMGHLLAAHDVDAGQRIGLMTSNRAEFFFTVFGALKIGASVVMISPAWKPTEIAHAVGLTEPVLVVCDGDTPDRLSGIVADDRVLHLDHDGVFEALVQGDGTWPNPDLLWDDTEAILVFSSGTTGLPKAVRHNHRSLGAATLHWASALGLTADDRFQVATPPFHILGLLNMFASVCAGSSVRLHPRFDLDAVLRCVETDRITLEMAVAPIALAMANHPELESFDLSSLRYIMWGATPVTPSVAETVTRRSGVGFLPAYGASEVPVITANPVNRPDAWRLDSPGLALHDIRLRIVDVETGEVLDAGGVGEIQVHSPSAMIGYLPEEANTDAFSDGWYRTGDVGWLEADGWLHITDRVKEMIKVRGFQVAPAEVEAVLHAHDDVVDCAVFGLPEEASGEVVVAAVQLRPDATVSSAELQDSVADALASYKRITHVYLVDEIPRLPSGKVLRRVLRETFG
ncbi:MAG: acyl--CoA ligase [Acidimicrobiales bacterium]|nr:acyl--CoA ligase [Acidimicrobiales bacterium]